MSVKIYDDDKRTSIILLNPQEKRNKAFKELKTGVRITNAGAVKIGNNGKPLTLTKAGRAYRSGYIAAQNDSAKCFKKKHPRYVSKTKN